MMKIIVGIFSMDIYNIVLLITRMKNFRGHRLVTNRKIKNFIRYMKKEKHRRVIF